MSDRTSPVRNDIIVFGQLSNELIWIKFADIENLEILQEYKEFSQKLIARNTTIGEMTSHLEKWYDRPKGWFIDSFINNAFMGALDTVSNKICGKPFFEGYGVKTANCLAVEMLAWAAFVAEKYDAKEEPEIYSEVS